MSHFLFRNPKNKKKHGKIAAETIHNDPLHRPVPCCFASGQSGLQLVSDPSGCQALCDVLSTFDGTQLGWTGARTGPFNGWKEVEA